MEFISLAETRKGVEDLALRVGHDHIYDINGFPLVRSSVSAPTLLAGIERYSRGVRGIHSGMGVVLARGKEESVKLILQKSFDIGVPGFSQTEWLGIFSLVCVVQLFAGRTWQPDLISLRSTRVIPPLAQAFFPDTQIMRGQETTHISFPKQRLSLSPSSFGTEVVKRLESESKVYHLLEPPVDLSDTLLRLLAAYLPDGYLALEGAAEVIGVSPRTLQRRLAEDGIEYSWLVERTRFDVASRMLIESDASSLDIAFATGYEDPSHFARAFRRMTACSPREYRRRNASQTQD